VFFNIHIGHFLKKVVARLTEHDDVIKPAQRGPVTLCYVNFSVKMKNAPPLAYYQSYSFNLTLIINHRWRKSFTSAK